ncbi:low affinity iron permease family protein [Rhizobium sullae]|uniref:Low affinity iron permease family protein n=1 Tax=Rhizobium sullae TaxID=50338 RepID=A0A2N0CYZ6_RHISU|nr:low affinity iron permease family protein [Rhizobium sullae]PKA39071.1 low affinity iron permease family protein [Rhizobium sullae]UWU15888.1 low affinity iron permease family protein [Rhizobium sullae]
MATPQQVFARFASTVSEWAGKPAIFVLALATVIVWAVSGPFFDYSETWQLVINTGTTIVTFLMVFVLQNAQTRDTRAIQAKLDELILTSRAENRFIGIENLDDEALEHMDRLVAKAAKEKGSTEAGSVSEAGGRKGTRSPGSKRVAPSKARKQK